MCIRDRQKGVGQQSGPRGLRRACFTLEQRLEAPKALEVAFCKESFSQSTGGVVGGGVYAHVLGRGFQRGKLCIREFCQQESSVCRQGGGVLFPHVLLDGLEGRMECGGIRAALSPAVHSVGAAPQSPEGPQCIVVAQLDVPPGGGGLEVEDVAQLPVASDEGGGQAGAGGAGDAHTLQVLSLIHI